MAYQLKYYFGFKPAGKNENHVVQLWQNTDDVLVAEEVTGGVPPFTVEYPEINHKFQPVRGSGCNINLFSETDMKFFVGLEHIDPQEFMVIHLIDGVKNWVGFLNSDMYTEPYDQSENYIINTTGTDGFSLMDRLRFIQSDGTDYVGVKSLWEIIEIILVKVNLPYNDIRVSLSTSFTEMVTNVLTDCYIDCENFYNEDGLAMTLREVMEGILNPFGAFICQINASIYITDIHTLSGGDSITYQKFSTTTFEYVEDIIETNNLKSISDIGYKGTGQSIDRSGGVNRQVVTYSPYPKKVVIDNQIVSVDEFTTIGTPSTKHGYYYNELTGHENYQAASFEQSWYNNLLPVKIAYALLPTNYSLGPVVFSFNSGGVFKKLYLTGGEVGNRKLKVTDYYGNPINYAINLIQPQSQWNISYTNDALSGIALLIQCEILPVMSDNPYLGVGSSTPIISVHSMGFTCQIGDLYFDQTIRRWVTVQPDNETNRILTTDSGESFSNKWVGLGENGNGLLMPLVGENDSFVNFSGQFIFNISSDIKMSDGKSPAAINSSLRETWLRNISIRIVNLDGSEIDDSDKEYVGLLDERYSQEGEDISLICGTETLFCDRGKLMKEDDTDLYSAIYEFTRAGQTFKIEELLLNSLCSNYKKNFLTLNSVKLKNDFSLINTITDTFISGKIMMVSGAVIDYREDEATVKLTEIVEDELDIILT